MEATGTLSTIPHLPPLSAKHTAPKSSFSHSPFTIFPSSHVIHCARNQKPSKSKPQVPTSRNQSGGVGRGRETRELNIEVSPHRAVAAVRLLRIERGGAFADLLNDTGKGSGRNEMEYVERTLGFRTRELDSRDLKLILRIGSYEIVKADMPPYAAVHEEDNSLPSPFLDGDDRTFWRALATIHSHPVWMVKRWIQHIGLEAAIQLMTWNNTEPCFSLRANMGKGLTRANLITQLNMLNVTHEPSMPLDEFVRIRTGMQAVIQAGLLKDGLCSVQDESAGLVVSVVDPRPGDNIIDCCAAPGGKTLFMASRLSAQGMIHAIDINKGRLRILQESAYLQQVHSVVTAVHSDLRTFAESCKVKFDKVLLDAPCSGFGVLSKRPDLRWNRKFEDMEELKKLQDELLDSSSKLVKAGGVLVYSTCSIDPEENEERVAAFLLRHPEFCIDPADRYVPQTFLTKQGFYRSCPVEHSMDGAFAARLLLHSSRENPNQDS
ncbi:putative ribosomal RNA small subunit methyltransferase B [Drosera capensis]